MLFSFEDSWLYYDVNFIYLLIIVHYARSIDIVFVKVHHRCSLFLSYYVCIYTTYTIFHYCILQLY